MKYKGYEYTVDIMAEPDVVKRWHEVIHPNGEKTHIDWSQYDTMDEKEFQLFIDLGLPDRNHFILEERRNRHNSNIYCPLDSKDLEYISEQMNPVKRFFIEPFED